MAPTTTPMGGARRAEQPLTRSADWWGGGAAGEETPAWLQKLKDGMVPSEVRPRRRSWSAHDGGAP
jgi:hypothetical protein